MYRVTKSLLQLKYRVTRSLLHLMYRVVHTCFQSISQVWRRILYINLDLHYNVLDTLTVQLQEIGQIWSKQTKSKVLYIDPGCNKKLQHFKRLDQLYRVTKDWPLVVLCNPRHAHCTMHTVQIRNVNHLFLTWIFKKESKFFFVRAGNLRIIVIAHFYFIIQFISILVVYQHFHNIC